MGEVRSTVLVLNTSVSYKPYNDTMKHMMCRAHLRPLRAASLDFSTLSNDAKRDWESSRVCKFSSKIFCLLSRLQKEKKTW